MAPGIPKPQLRRAPYSLRRSTSRAGALRLFSYTFRLRSVHSSVMGTRAAPRPRYSPPAYRPSPATQERGWGRGRADAAGRWGTSGLKSQIAGLRDRGGRSTSFAGMGEPGVRPGWRGHVPIILPIVTILSSTIHSRWCLGLKIVAAVSDRRARVFKGLWRSESTATAN